MCSDEFNISHRSLVLIVTRQVMKLVEVIRTEQTDEAAVQATLGFGVCTRASQSLTLMRELRSAQHRQDASELWRHAWVHRQQAARAIPRAGKHAIEVTICVN